MQPIRRIIVGISGASGAIYGIRLLQACHDLPVETHLVITRAGDRTIALETDFSPRAVRGLADHSYPVSDIGGAIASGSFRTAGMIVAPCSIRSMAAIATGMTSNLLTRAADVCLKERRRLVLMVRETPLHGGHLRTMAELSDLGAVIAPPMPAFYNRPASLDDVVRYQVGRLLDLFDLPVELPGRWGEPGSSA